MGSRAKRGTLPGAVVMGIDAAVRSIELAVAGNPNCTTGLFTLNRVVGIQKGPSGGEEILALLYADDPWFGYWYGHILRHPKNREVFVSLLAWSVHLPNAPTVPLFFRRFHFWVTKRGVIRPCAIQNRDDAYQEDSSLGGAAANLAKIIGCFSLEKRRGNEDSPYANDPLEPRVLDAYRGWWVPGLDAPIFPMPTPLTVVKNSGGRGKYFGEPDMY
ncbi:MAG: hypothetical protein PHE17_15010 [Thiothrix sp.]|uniref:hypothetical protein n=1 Tax=Thiothrix sp. TaxID=1032 RepID=UPI00260BE24D|nr:hypothetical protein [Thiothrix sp.]MDD5394322.1 hypothetical protein [Thiothrix sp.]